MPISIEDLKESWRKQSVTNQQALDDFDLIYPNLNYQTIFRDTLKDIYYKVLCKTVVNGNVSLVCAFVDMENGEETTAMHINVGPVTLENYEIIA